MQAWFFVSGKLIVFSGIDGAGKSTQIDLLVERLRRRGLRPLVFWSRIGYTPGMMWLKWILRRVFPAQIVPPVGDSQRRAAVMARQSTRKWWLRLSILDMGWHYAIWLRGMRWLGYTVICDRHVVDAEMDFKLNFPDQSVEHWWLWKFLKCTATRPSSAFMLLVPVQVSQQRSQQKKEPFPDSYHRLEQRLAGYRKHCEVGEWCLLDGTMEVVALSKQIYQAAFSQQAAIRQED